MRAECWILETAGSRALSTNVEQVWLPRSRLKKVCCWVKTLKKKWTRCSNSTMNTRTPSKSLKMCSSFATCSEKGAKPIKTSRSRGRVRADGAAPWPTESKLWATESRASIVCSAGTRADSHSLKPATPGETVPHKTESKLTNSRWMKFNPRIWTSVVCSLVIAPRPCILKRVKTLSSMRKLR